MLHSELISATESRADGTRPLMLMLHGLGDSIEGYRWMPEELKLPWLNFLLINAPDEYYGGYSWFDYPGDMLPGIVRSRKLLLGLLDDLSAKNFPPEQITLGGFSQGSLMAMDIGLHYPHRFAGLVGISGWIYEVEKLIKEIPPVAKQQRLLMTHGPFDPLIPFDAVREQVRKLQTAGLNVEWREFPKAHTIYGEAEISVVREFVRAGYA